MRSTQKNPENHRDMLVRVAGYSTYFVELGKPFLIHNSKLLVNAGNQL